TAIPSNTMTTTAKPAGADKKIAAGICGILLGGLGIHKFILGYTKEGVIMLLISVLTLGLGAFISGIIGLIEGIIYLTKSDEDFLATYATGKKGWFYSAASDRRHHFARPSRPSGRPFCFQPCPPSPSAC